MIVHDCVVLVVVLEVVVDRRCGDWMLESLVLGPICADQDTEHLTYTVYDCSK